MNILDGPRSHKHVLPPFCSAKNPGLRAIGVGGFLKKYWKLCGISSVKQVVRQQLMAYITSWKIKIQTQFYWSMQPMHYYPKASKLWLIIRKNLHEKTMTFTVTQIKITSTVKRYLEAIIRSTSYKNVLQCRCLNE